MSDFSSLSFLLFRLIWLYDFQAVTKLCEVFVIILAVALARRYCSHLSSELRSLHYHPLPSVRYTEIVTKTHVKLAFLVAWGAPVVSMIVLPLFYGDSASSQFRTSTTGCSESTSEPPLLGKVHLVLNITLFDAIPFAVM